MQHRHSNQRGCESGAGYGDDSRFRPRDDDLRAAGGSRTRAGSTYGDYAPARDEGHGWGETGSSGYGRADMGDHYSGGSNWEHGRDEPWRDNPGAHAQQYGGHRPQPEHGAGDDRSRDAGRHEAQQHDADYHEWREQQLRALDDDYEAWRKERYQKFCDEFGQWRQQRQAQASSTAAGEHAASTNPYAASGVPATSGSGAGSTGPSLDKGSEY